MVYAILKREAGVKIGIAANQIEKAWGTTNGRTGWFAIGLSNDAAEDHCVSLCGYGTISWLAQQLNAQVPGGVNGSQQAYAMFTWNSIGVIDAPSMTAITHEAWVRQPTTVINNRVVRVYVDSDFQGAGAALGVGRYDWGQLGISNDSLSSLRVPAGLTATLYEDVHFSGRSKVFTQDASYVGDDFNDITSSIIVAERTAAGREVT
jgi:hypothetical protein